MSEVCRARRVRPPQLDRSRRRVPHPPDRRRAGVCGRDDGGVPGALQLVRACHRRHRGHRRRRPGLREQRHARWSADQSDRRRRHRRRRQRRRLRAADRAAVPVHRAARGFGLPGARGVRHRPRDARGRAARPRVRADALGLLVRGAGGDGDAHAREPHRSPADDAGAAADVVQRPAAGLRADDGHGLCAREPRRVPQRRCGGAVLRCTRCRSLRRSPPRRSCAGPC